jgi:hypothetical protein
MPVVERIALHTSNWGGVDEHLDKERGGGSATTRRS